MVGKEKTLFITVFSFPHNVLGRNLYLSRQNSGLLGTGLTLYYTTKYFDLVKLIALAGDKKCILKNKFTFVEVENVMEKSENASG